MASQNDGEFQATKTHLIGMFTLMLLVNFDSGAVPASLVEISEEFSLNYVEAGLLGSLAFLGTLLTCIFGPRLLRQEKLGRVLAIATGSNALSCLLFGFSQQRFLLFFARLLVGLTQAVLVIFAPVWADEFAPEASSATWMATLQGAVPFGVMVGYLVAGITTWRAAFVAQAVLLVPFVLAFLFVNPALIDISKRSKGAVIAEVPVDGKAPSLPQGKKATQGADAKPPHLSANKLRRRSSTMFDLSAVAFPEATLGKGSAAASPAGDGRGTKQPIGMKMLAKNRIFVFTVLAIASLYFVVASIQYWSTDFLQTEIKAEKSEVLTFFAIVTATGPTLGVLFGGWFIDKRGGYAGPNGRKRTLKILTFLALGAWVIGFPAAFVSNLWWYMIPLWFELFLGGAVVPGAVGLMLGSVPPAARPLASAAQLFSGMLLGHFLSPLASGLVMELISRRAGVIFFLAWGVQCWILLWLARLDAVAQIQRARDRRRAQGSSAPLSRGSIVMNDLALGTSDIVVHSVTLEADDLPHEGADRADGRVWSDVPLDRATRDNEDPSRFAPYAYDDNEAAVYADDAEDSEPAFLLATRRMSMFTPPTVF